MTVHASKGLQAPIVIMADSAAKPPPDRTQLFWMRDRAQDRAGDLDLPIFCPRRDSHCEESRRFQALMQARAAEEHHRLLYVAMTRAEDHLIVCGWEGGAGAASPSWHELIGRGFERLGVPVRETPGGWPETRHVLAAPQRRPPPAAAPAAAAATAPAGLPGWMGRGPLWQAMPPPAEPARPRPLAPSRPEDALFGPVPQADSPVRHGAASTGAGGEAGFARGTLIHSLLQHLPQVPPEDRARAGRSFLARGGSGLDHEDTELVLGQCLGVLDHPELRAAFGPGSRAEVPVAGEVAGIVITGIIDRLAVTESAVVALDFKTGRQPPAEVAQTPVLYLRQMAAYRALLVAIFPGRQIDCALVWTETATVSALPPALLDRHAPGREAQAIAT